MTADQMPGAGACPEGLDLLLARLPGTDKVGADGAMFHGDYRI
ncbi:hypothetical protein [Rugosimonospora acidiphila]